MGHELRVERLARRFSAWRSQAASYHNLLTLLAEAPIVADALAGPDVNGSVTGSVTVRLDAPTWAAVQAAAADAPPEPPDLIA